MPKRITIISHVKTTTHHGCITDNDILQHTALIVAQQVPTFPGCVAPDAHTVLKVEPVDNDDEYEIVNKPALLH